MDNQELFCLLPKSIELIDVNNEEENINDSACENGRKKRKINDTEEICGDMGAIVDCVEKEKDEEIIEKRYLSIDILNYDCLSKIFSHLSIGERLHMEKVCTKWKEAVDQLGWHDVTNFDCFNYDFIRKNFGKRFVVQTSLEQVLTRCGPYLTHLSFVPKYDSEIMSVVSGNCHNLTKLELYFNVYYDEHFVNAFTKMDKLKVIRIKNYIRQRNAGITNDNEILQSLPADIEEIVFSTPSLRHSALSKNFASTFGKFTSLRSLTLSHWSLEDYVLRIITQKRTLTYLSLVNCEIHNGFLIPTLINLEHLDLNNVQNIDDNILINIINNCKNLTHLNISSCNDITKYSLNHISSAENLNELFVNGICDFDDSVINRLQNIKILECRSCIDVTDIGIIRILNNSPSLERLDISDTGVTSLIIRCASDVCARRFDNNKLYIVARDSLIKQFDGMDSISPFLIIEECKKKKLPTNRRNYYHYTIQYRRGRRIYFFNLH